MWNAPATWSGMTRAPAGAFDGRVSSAASSPATTTNPAGTQAATESSGDATDSFNRWREDADLVAEKDAKLRAGLRTTRRWHSRR